MMEHAALGDLQKVRLDPAALLSLRLASALDVARGLRFCRDRELTHRDVKSGHVCVSATIDLFLQHHDTSPVANGRQVNKTLWPN